MFSLTGLPDSIDSGFIPPGRHAPAEFSLPPTARARARDRLPSGFDALHRHPRASPVVKRAVRGSLRVRPRVFSTPRRFAHARVPRPCFVPQPILDCLPTSFPLAEIAHPFRGRLASSRFFTHAPSAVSAPLSPSVSLHLRRAWCFPARPCRVPPPTMSPLFVSRS